MLSAVQIADGLWQCLCPSFRRPPTQWLSQSAARKPFRALRPSSHLRANTSLSRTWRRSYTSDPRPIRRHVRNDKSAGASKTLPFPQNRLSAAARAYAAALGVPADVNPTYDPEPVRAALAETSLTAVYRLLDEAAQDAEYDWVHFVVLHLVHERGERPNARHYAALVLANASPEFGSAREVEALLADMEVDGIEFATPIYLALIKVRPARSPCSCADHS